MTVFADRVRFKQIISNLNQQRRKIYPGWRKNQGAELLSARLRVHFGDGHRVLESSPRTTK